MNIPSTMRYSKPSLARVKSTALHSFYQMHHLDVYASRDVQRLTLRQLIFFGRSMDEERLIKSANYVRTELPVRIAHRLKDLQALPYVVVTQEGVTSVYQLYCSAFEKFRCYPPISTLAENDAFCQFLKAILDEHAPVIPSLALGLSLSSPFLSSEQLDSFMRRMLISRISRRVIAEHHIALSSSFAGNITELPEEPDVGIIFTGLNVKRSVEKCATLLSALRLNVQDDDGKILDTTVMPEVIVDGHMETRFPYIREHLEYIVFELLKNSMRATRMKHRYSSRLPPIQVTIVAGGDDVGIRISDQGGGLLIPQINSPSDLLSFSHICNATRLDDSRLDGLRLVSSSPSGMKATVDEQIRRGKKSDYISQSPALHGNKSGTSITAVPRPRIGIGLPMSNIFATYFGGSLELVSLDGWGTDVYLRLPKLGTNLEDIEV